jgi:16S rRNA (cytosine967-C5)-methyltransferase
VDAARLTAFKVLRLVEGGGYASELLLTRAAKLDSRDAALATELVFGVLRRRLQLDYLIAHYSGRSADKLDSEVRLALELGIYQIRYLTRIPKHAAVQASVELVKHARLRSASGLVNAVLRKVDRSPVPWPDRATALSCPEWLLESWERQFGPETAEAIAKAFLKPAPASVNPETGRVQDEGGRGIVGLLQIEPGVRLLDVCAAPGNKTAQALALGADCIACDRHLSRLRVMTGLGAKLVAADATRPLPFAAKFPRILVDAPCSGTGTLARNPEIKWRLKPDKLVELQALQRAILEHALQLLAPGGRLVYATCSLEREENEDVVRSFQPLEVHRWLPGLGPGDGFFAAVITCG